jgi:hypothetical protein
LWKIDSGTDPLLATQFGNETISLQDTQFSSESWFAIGHPIRQRNLFRCRPPDSAAKTISFQATRFGSKTVLLQATQFDNENCFVAGHTI